MYIYGKSFDPIYADNRLTLPLGTDEEERERIQQDEFEAILEDIDTSEEDIDTSSSKIESLKRVAVLCVFIAFAFGFLVLLLICDGE